MKTKCIFGIIVLAIVSLLQCEQRGSSFCSSILSKMESDPVSPLVGTWEGMGSKISIDGAGRITETPGLSEGYVIGDLTKVDGFPALKKQRTGNTVKLQEAKCLVVETSGARNAFNLVITFDDHSQYSLYREVEKQNHSECKKLNVTTRSIEACSK